MNAFLKIFALILCVISCPGIVAAQTASPYHLDWKKDLSLIVGGSALVYGGAKLSDRHEKLRSHEIPQFKSSNVVAFDRSATTNFSTRSGQNSDLLRNAAWALPVVFLPSRRMRNGLPTIGIMALETFLITQGGTTMVKGLAGRTRPFVYNPDVPLEEKTGGGTRLSFFSGHTSVTASLSFFTAKVINDYSSNIWVKRFVWVGAAALPAAVGYFRVRAGKHFPTDVITGYAFGALVGFFIPHLHRNKENKNRKLSIAPSLMQGGSMGFNLTWALNR